ncbi:MAG: hypothetical protein JWQ87_5335 [Candidatus Sulfotelmatobacter sp.]|nr:hypothetical protein [Candidatus Sulfotelmatobacter sp.]
MNLFIRPNISTLLESIAEELDISPELHQEAVLRYEDVGDWLGAPESPLERYAPEIYPQGSFRLGTVVRPMKDDGEFDIDLVCRISREKDQTTQDGLKQLVGDRLKSRGDLNKALKESRRCWRLNFESDFHMDVLPCLPNPPRLPNGLLLTDKDLLRWQKSNPIDYASWFYGRMQIAFDLKRQHLAESLSASVQDVPEWQVRTPLQRVIQVLKRHRDLYFDVDDPNTPTSIIITTLAARAYQNQLDVQEALHAILSNMADYISYQNGRWVIMNPVEPDENFADKWNEKPARREAFIQWLERAKLDFGAVAENKSLTESVDLLRKSLGAAEVNRAVSRLTVQGGKLVAAPVIVELLQAPPLGPTAHIQTPPWRQDLTHKVKIVANTYSANKKKKIAPLGSYALTKQTMLRFTAKTNVKGTFVVKWQVVNTGEEATAKQQLRGDFYDSEGQNYRWEHAGYAGTHWVEAFVIKEDVCVARSGRTHVKVRS